MGNGYKSFREREGLLLKLNEEKLLGFLKDLEKEFKLEIEKRKNDNRLSDYGEGLYEGRIMAYSGLIEMIERKSAILFDS